MIFDFKNLIGWWKSGQLSYLLFQANSRRANLKPASGKLAPRQPDGNPICMGDPVTNFAKFYTVTFILLFIPSSKIRPCFCSPSP